METSVIYTIKALYNTLSNKEKVIADYILKNPLDSVSPSIDALSSMIGISDATMVRFVRKLGFPGYQQFRICLARETVPVDDKELIDEGLDSIQAAILSTKSSLDETFSQINHNTVKKAGAMISKCKQLFIAGMGGSGIIAEDMYHRFISTGISCHHSIAFHTQLLLASQSNEKDLAVIFCHTGIDVDAIAIAEEYQRQNCPIIVITAQPKAPINKFATIGLYIANSQPSPIVEIFSERIASMVLVDALYIEVAKNQRKINERIAAINKSKRVVASRRL
jgi:DNA-binding MurR/RpiR family transcriptional regulator